jgi:hypothetical protein
MQNRGGSANTFAIELLLKNEYLYEAKDSKLSIY